jgi:transposase-like protein
VTAIEATWHAATHQTCVVHLGRHTLRLVQPQGLAAHHARAARHLHRTDRRGCPGQVRRLQRVLGSSKYPAIIRSRSIVAGGYPA